MPRPYAIITLVTAVIFCVIMISGCSEKTQTDTPAYNYSVPASGHVYLEGNAVSGSRVIAVSADGAYRTSNVTNESGGYVLYLVPWTRYNVTATYQGLKQTIWPVYLRNRTGFYIVNEDMTDRYDIDLSKAQKATITGIASESADFSTGISNVLIVATPADGSPPLSAVTGDDGTYSLDLKPGISYSLTGKYHDVYGQYCGIQFAYRNNDYSRNLTLRQGETAFVDARVYWVHPPMLLYNERDLGNNTFRARPSVPTTVSGFVFLDGKTIKGATVEAIAITTGNRVLTVTNDSGGYSLGLNTIVIYNITATYQGLRHTTGPVFPEDNETGVIYINLTSTPAAGITGRPPGNEPWLFRPGKVTIEAVPQYGGKTMKTITGDDHSYRLELEPHVYYNLTGRFPDSKGVYHDISFTSSTGVVISEIMVRPNETVIIDYFTHVAYE